jgi:iron complex transport system ATP-binding protein
MVHLEEKTEHLMSQLSDGERQRAMIARALAQDTPIVLLDEPTAHLDLPNRVEIMLLLHKLAHETGKGILLSTHELDLALQAGDRIWLMDAKKGVECGTPEDLVFNGSFNRTFESENYIFNPANGNFSMNYRLQKNVSVSGDKTRMYWTLRALARAGFQVVEQADTEIVVNSTNWSLSGKEVGSVEELLFCLQKNKK